MADIDVELSKIENEEGGEVVRGAIALAADKIANEKELDITNELEIFSQGRFGIDIRTAIHDALDKMNRSKGGGGGIGGGTVGIFVRSETTVFDPIQESVISYARIKDPTKPADYNAYVFPASTGAIYWTIDGREYGANITAETIIFVDNDLGGYTGAVLISEDPDSVTFSCMYGSCTYMTTMNYGGKTLYLSGTGMWMGGMYGDSTGTLKTYPISLPYISAPEQAAKAVLDYLRY